LTAHSLNYILLTVAETYFVAANNGEKSGGKEIRAVIEAGVRDVSFWMPKYVRARATHMTVEVEEKYKGGGGPLGKAGQKRTTGWFIVHDKANDPVVGTFEGQRFPHYPKKEELVSERFYSIEAGPTQKPVWEGHQHKQQAELKEEVREKLQPGVAISCFVLTPAAVGASHRPSEPTRTSDLNAP
jgi:hypothetical protein